MAGLKICCNTPTYSPNHLPECRNYAGPSVGCQSGGEAWPKPTTLPAHDLPSNDATLVNHPPHYNQGKVEVITAIEDWKLPYHLGNVVKYVARAPYKGEQMCDLKKAQWYLNRYIVLMERA